MQELEQRREQLPRVAPATATELSEQLPGTAVEEQLPRWPGACVENVMIFAFLAEPAASGDNELPLGAAVVIIETTDNDIELQVFVGF